MTIGERIKIIRKELSLNQEQFGKKINVKQSTVGSWESGIRSVLDRPTKDICRVFHISYAWLTNGDGDMFSSSDAAIKEKVDQIMESENDFHKKLIESVIDLDDETLIALKKLVDKLVNKKTD